MDGRAKTSRLFEVNRVLEPQVIENLPQLGLEVGGVRGLDGNRKVDPDLEVFPRAELWEDARPQAVPQLGGDVAVACNRPTLTRLLRTTGFDRIVTVTDTIEEAAAALEGDSNQN